MQVKNKKPVIAKKANKNKQAKNSSREMAKRLSKKVLNTAIDLVVFSCSLGLGVYAASGSTRNPKTPIDIISSALKTTSIIKKQRLKNALHNSSNQKLIKKESSGFSLTKEGKIKLGNILPKYQKNRPWNRKLYLITYDITENQKRSRDKLREKLKDLSCGMVQRSVWLTPHNPTAEIEKITAYLKLEEAVIVSTLEETKSIWGETLLNLIWKTFNLEILNRRYEAFISKVEEKKKTKNNLLNLVFLYLSILKEDPQLPRQLLKENWLGDSAHQIFKKKALSPLFSKIQISGPDNLSLSSRQTLLELIEVD